jgi:hypothetical protein
VPDALRTGAGCSRNATQSTATAPAWRERRGAAAGNKPHTTFEAARPGSVTRMEGKRSVVELTQIQVFDGGADGVVSTTPNTLFAVQRVFIP